MHQETQKDFKQHILTEDEINNALSKLTMTIEQQPQTVYEPYQQDLLTGSDTKPSYLQDQQALGNIKDLAADIVNLSTMLKNNGGRLSNTNAAYYEAWRGNTTQQASRWTGSHEQTVQRLYEKNKKRQEALEQKRMEALYEEAREERQWQMSYHSQVILEQRGSAYVPLPQRLHTLQQEKEERLERLKFEVREERERELKVVQELYGGRRCGKNDVENFLQHIQLWLERKDLKSLQLRQEVARAEESQLSFKPTINAKSRKIVGSGNINARMRTREEKLFLRRQKSVHEQKIRYPFAPILDKKSLKLAAQTRKRNDSRSISPNLRTLQQQDIKTIAKNTNNQNTQKQNMRLLDNGKQKENQRYQINFQQQQQRFGTTATLSFEGQQQQHHYYEEEEEEGDSQFQQQGQGKNAIKPEDKTDQTDATTPRVGKLNKSKSFVAEGKGDFRVEELERQSNQIKELFRQVSSNIKRDAQARFQAENSLLAEQDSLEQYHQHSQSGTSNGQRQLTKNYSHAGIQGRVSEFNADQITDRREDMPHHHHSVMQNNHSRESIQQNQEEKNIVNFKDHPNLQRIFQYLRK